MQQGSLGDGLKVLRIVVSTLTLDRCPAGSCIEMKLVEDFKIECRKFLCYRAYKIHDRQIHSLQRMRCLLAMIEDVRAHAA